MKDELSTSNEQLLTIDAVVLANGEYPASPLPLKILAEALMWFVATVERTNTSAGAILPT